MSTETKTKTNTPKTEKHGPGRPKYTPKFPTRAKWTFRDFCMANGVNPDTLKAVEEGKGCTGLTLRKFLDRDAARKGNSLVKKLDELAPPENADGLGRKSFLFSLRSKLTATPAKKNTPKNALKKASKSNVTVTVSDAPAPAPDAVPTPAPAETVAATDAAPVATDAAPAVA
jgi:hypothetical protein